MQTIDPSIRGDSIAIREHPRCSLFFGPTDRIARRGLATRRLQSSENFPPAKALSNASKIFEWLLSPPIENAALVGNSDCEKLHNVGHPIPNAHFSTPASGMLKVSLLYFGIFPALGRGR